MKNRLSQRVLSLLLTFALVMSLAGTAGAAEIAAELADSSEELTMAEDVEATETADLDIDIEETAETAETAETEEAVSEETESAENGEEAASVETTEEETAENPMQEQETASPSDTTDSGWSVEIDRTTGEYELSFAYEGEDGTLTDAADGYYEIPQGTAEVDGESYTFESGIYYFDESGSCEQALEEENVYVEVSELSVTEDSYTVTDESTYEVSLGGVSCEDNVISSDVELFSGVEELNELYHKFTNGEDQGVYTGSFLQEDLNQICYATKGKILTTTGSYHWYQKKLYYFSKTKNGVAVGTAYTGVHKFSSSLPTSVAGTYDTGVYYYMKNGVGVEDDGGYHWFNGKLYYFSGSDTQKDGISTGTVYSGYHYCGSIPSSVSGYTAKRWYLFKNGVGTLLNGYVADKHTYYNKGVVDTSVTGWKTISGGTYYFKKGVALTGWNYVKRNGLTYKYYFKSDGKLVTDLYSYFGNSYYKVSQRIYVNRYTNNITIYQYDSETKSYDIPLKSMVCSTSRSMNLKYGTYTVSKLARWYHKGKWYWQYLTRIGSTGALFHSCRYYSRSTSSMQTSNYNSMGRCNTDLCVRSSVGACRLIYNIVNSQSKGSVKCKYYYAKNNGPFGRVTIANTTGTVKGKKGKDPTQ